MKVPPADVTDLQTIERERLLSLIDFSYQSARLRGKPAPTVSAHSLFALHENEIQGLPGIRLNVNSTEGEDEIWLAVGRLHETPPPEITESLLQPWIQLTHVPTEEPKLRAATDGASLIAAGTHCAPGAALAHNKPAASPGEMVTLSEYDKAEQVRALFEAYLEHQWRAWAREERLRRKTIGLYSELFTLKQKLEGRIVETQVELVWGAGFGIWNVSGYDPSAIRWSDAWSNSL